MRAVITPHCFGGTVRIPGSKSHTIRRLLIAALAGGDSEIEYPLDSLDAFSCLSICRALGAEIEEFREADPSCPNPPDESGKRLLRWKVRGTGGRISHPAAPLDVGNSGTTLFLALAAAALGAENVTFTGDEQIRRRSAGPLLEALGNFGIAVKSEKNGCAPITIRGPWLGGRTSLPCPTSQYLSAILLAAPLAPAGRVTEIDVPLLNEKPYIELTLSYLDAQGIIYEKKDDFSYFRIPGGASYKPLNGKVPGDFSSAAFPALAAVVSAAANGPAPGSAAGVRGLTLLGLDPADSQGDKAFFSMLGQMGCGVDWRKLDDGGWALALSLPGKLAGGTFDLNDTPDLLPAMAVLGLYARGETALVNAAHARIKETDRIAVMASELAKFGGELWERPDGLVIKPPERRLVEPGKLLAGWGDHRVVMALAAAALGAEGPVTIDQAECAAVTYPGFLELLDADIVY